MEILDLETFAHFEAKEIAQMKTLCSGRSNSLHFGANNGKGIGPCRFYRADPNATDSFAGLYRAVQGWTVRGVRVGLCLLSRYDGLRTCQPLWTIP